MKRRYCVIWCGFLLLLNGPMETVSANEARQAETQSTIGFTGTYVPIGTPNPAPPITEIAQPGGVLPQTNTVTSQWLLGWGILILTLGFWFWRQKQTQTKNNQKESRNHS